MEIIQLKQEDSAALSRFRAIASQESAFVNPMNLARATEVLKAKEHPGLAWGVKDKSDLVAQILLDDKYSGHLHIESLGVLKRFSGLGLATGLLNKAEEIALNKKLEWITLVVMVQNKPAIALYRKHGYEDYHVSGKNISYRKRIGNDKTSSSFVSEWSS